MDAPRGFVLDLANIDGSMLALVGGKAGNLGEMMRAGLPVPPGFCVTTEAYREVATGAAIDFDALSAPKAADASRLAAAAREALVAAPVPGAVVRAVRDAYARLGGAVAVRSSATAEDLPFASFAGQQDTYLSIVGEEAVLDAVRRCWASLWTERAVVYRAKQAILPSSVRLAVVVQRMVEAEIAGILFTANPVTGRRRQAVIDASPGLGEAVVSGAVNPDHFVVDTERREILERRLGDKRVEIRAKPGGGTTHIEAADRANEACVTDAQVLALAALGDRVERHYGAPQDTEWAIDATGRLWLTQARPITTLFEIPRHPRATAPSNDFRVYFCFSLAQGLERPITPMGRAAFRLLSSNAEHLASFRAADPEGGARVYAEGGQRFFLDFTSVVRSAVGRAVIPRVLDWMEARSAAVLRGLFDEPRLSVTHASPFGFLRRILRIFIDFAVPFWAVRALVNPDSAHARARSVGEALARRLEPPASASPHERVELAVQGLSREVLALGPQLLPLAAPGLGMLAFASHLLGEDVTQAELQTVLRGLPHNVTTEMDLELWRIAVELRRDVEAARAFREASVAELGRRYVERTLPNVAQKCLDEFLSVYGHRAVAEIDLGMPRWSDEPAHILGVLANYLRLEDPALAPDVVFARGAREADAMIDTLVARARKRSPLHADLVKFALGRARRLAGLRESPKFFIVLALATVRRSLAVVGTELAGRGAIETADDVFFLDLEEVRAALDGRDSRRLVSERRLAYEAELRRRHVPRVLLSNGTEPEATMLSAASQEG
ncbi:MAG TPA: PEP/pyruvate-binding domain-containing protein, partial [Polyangiaceae bacterium]|nr:PEP/pyruvate-binding domain-containing protein [Polyangiaceae bacterium]